MAKQLIFEIPEADPHSIPMTRLLEYLAELATLLGNRNHVHFLKVEEGSLPCFMEIDEQVETDVLARIDSVMKGGGTEEAQRAHTTLRRLLREDDYSAAIKRDGDIIAEFPPVQENKTLGPFMQDGFLDGLLINLGGKDETVPVHLLSEGADFRCNTSVDMARKLAPHLLQKPIRVYGRGRWYRKPNGKWHLDLFDISGFDEIDDSSIPEVVARLRAIPGNPLTSLKDPLEEMRKIRHGE
jgi:hypothetical protein